MMEGNKNVPKRRFDGFVGEWEEEKLEGLGVFGRTYAYSRAIEGAGNYYHVHYGDIHATFTGVITENTNIPSIKVEESHELLKDGDIVIADASEDYKDLGKAVVIQGTGNRKIIAGLHTFKFTPNEKLNSNFYLYYSQSNLFKSFSYKTGTGISVFGISKENMGKMEFNIPSYSEQQKIGHFFKQLDKQINLQQQKVEKAKAIKTAYLAEMFPAEGETVPKRRFDGFTGDWKERKVYSISDRFDNLRIPVTASERIPGDTPYYGANGIQDYVDGFTHEGEYILVAEDGANDLNDYPVHYVNGKVWVNNHAHVLQGKTGIADNKFLMYLFKTINMEPYLVGGSRAKLNADVMMNIEILLPILEVQQKIGHFFKKLDEKIAIEERRVEKLQALKQAYLHEMFV